jgi:hypothetical protein
MWHLIEPVLGHDRANLERFEQDIVAGIAHGFLDFKTPDKIEPATGNCLTYQTVEKSCR